MSFDPERAADELLRTQPRAGAFDPEVATDEVLKGHQAAAAQLLEANFEPGVYAPASLRWSLARGDNLKEKTLRLQKKYPQGELDTLKQSMVMGFEDDVLIWRESPQAQWKAVEPQGFDKFDIIEAIAPSAESIAGETAMAIGSSGASVPLTVARQVLGAIAGEAFEQGTQAVRGLQDQSLAEVTMEVGQEGLWSGIGGYAASPFVAAYNIARGAGALRVGEEGLDVLRAAREIDPKLAEKMTPGLVSDNPAIQTSEQQAAALLPGLGRRYRELISMVDSAVKTQSQGRAGQAMGRVVEGLKDFGDQFLRRLRVTGTRASEGGKAIQAGINQYSQQSRIITSALYNRARAIQEPQFDLNPVLNLANDLRIGAKGQLDPAVEAQIKELENISGPITLSRGDVLSVTDQIRNVRTELWSLKHVEPGSVANQKTGQANDLYRAITNTLENPSNTDQAFRSAWRTANDAAAERFAKLEAAPIVASARSAAPSELVRTYLRPYNPENLLTIRNTVPADKWNLFVDAAYSEMLRNPADLSKTIKAFDQETLDVFMPRADQEAFRRVGRELDRINSIGVEEIAERQVKNRNFIDTLITGAEPRDAQTLIRAMNNTNNRAMRQSVRAAIIEWAWDGVIEETKAGLKINRGVIVSNVNQLKKSGLWSILSTQDRRLVSNVKTVSLAFERVADAGTSILAASAVQGVKEMKASAIMTFVRNEIMAQFYMSSLGRKMLIGSGLPNSRGAMIRAVGGALAQTSQPEDISELIKDD